MSYQSGIIGADAGCPTEIDSCMGAVGYGMEDGVQYFIIRNSWGSEWGDHGYVRLATDGGDKGVCGVKQ